MDIKQFILDNLFYLSLNKINENSPININNNLKNRLNKQSEVSATSDVRQGFVRYQGAKDKEGLRTTKMCDLLDLS